jgi:hypothetical protein
MDATWFSVPVIFILYLLFSVFSDKSDSIISQKAAEVNAP